MGREELGRQGYLSTPHYQQLKHGQTHCSFFSYTKTTLGQNFCYSKYVYFAFVRPFRANLQLKNTSFNKVVRTCTQNIWDPIDPNTFNFRKHFSFFSLLLSLFFEMCCIYFIRSKCQFFFGLSRSRLGLYCQSS